MPSVAEKVTLAEPSESEYESVMPNFQSAPFTGSGGNSRGSFGIVRPTDGQLMSRYTTSPVTSVSSGLRSSEIARPCDAPGFA